MEAEFQSLFLYPGLDRCAKMEIVSPLGETVFFKGESNMGFFDRFRKTDSADLETLQVRGDWAGLARAYFAKGKEYLARGDKERADLWLARAQDICDSDDRVYEKLGDRFADECAEVRGELEGGLFGAGVVERIEAEYATLGGTQKRLWGLLTLCRLEKLLTAAGDIPGCGPLKNTGAVIDGLLDHYYGEAGDDAWEKLEEYNDFLFDWEDSHAYLDARSVLPAPAGEFQLMDLNGEVVPSELCLYLDVVVSGDLSREETQGLADPKVLDALDLNDQSGLVRCGLLTHYWLRGQDGPLDAVPQVKAEAARIWDDLAFLRTDPDEAAVRTRAAQYRALDILT